MNAAAQPQLSSGRILFIMTALVLSTVMASLDSSFVPIAVTDMIEDLESSTSEVVWVALGYLIAASGPMLLAARMADGFGHARFFQVGTSVYALAMIACTFAPDVTTLIALRVVQGFGMALFLSSTFAIATTMYGAEGRGKALGVLQAANAFGFVLGPLFAGWLLDAYDWRAIFGARIPFAVLAIVMAFAALGASRPFVFAKKEKSYDYSGAVFLTIALFGILFGCTRLPVEDNHLDPLVWAVFVGGFVFFWLFLRQERKAPAPLIDLSLFQSQKFTKAAIGFTAIFASFPIYLFVLPIVMIQALELKAWDAGLALGVVALATLLISPFAGRWADSYGAEKLCMAGAAFTGTGYLSLLFLNAESTIVSMLPGMTLIGLGTGLFFSPNNTLMLANPPPERPGMVSGLFGTLRQSGYALGFALTASLFTFVQKFMEIQWTYSALLLLPEDTALQMEQAFEQGCMWSPETLIFILHLSVILCTGILVLSFVNSFSALKMNLRRHAGLFAAAIGGAAVSMAAFAVTAPGYVDPDTAARPDAASIQADAAKSFGMASRSAEQFGVTGYFANARHSDAADSAAGAIPDVGGAASMAANDSGAGAALFNTHCSACHGADGEGVAGLGLNLVDSNLVADSSEAALQAFLRKGRMPGEPGSITGVPMPAFAWMNAEQLQQVATYVKGRAAR